MQITFAFEAQPKTVFEWLPPDIYRQDNAALRISRSAPISYWGHN